MLTFLRSHLQAKLTLAFALVLLIPTIITTGYNLTRSTDAIIQTTTTNELNVASLSIDHIQTTLAAMKGDLLFLRNDPGIMDFAAVLDGQNDPSALPDVDQLFANFLRNSTHRYKDIRVIDATGQEVIRVDDSLGQPNIILGTGLENKATRPYFVEAMKLAKDGVYFSGLDLNVTKGELDSPPLPVIRYSMPIYTEGGHLVGVLVLKALAETILAPLAPTDASKTTYLFDSKGNYWLNPDASKLYGTILGTNANFTNDQPHDAAFMTANPQGVLQASADRPDTFQTFIQIPLADEPGVQWTLVNTRPMDEILAQIIQARGSILVLSIIAFLVAVVIASVIAQSIVRPVRQLTTAAAEISQDRWDSPLPQSTSQDEIGSLTTSFHSMVEAVRDRNTRLNNLNGSLSAQTKELTKANALARESARLKSEFMSTMSHELRTPLNAILGFSGIMLQGMGGEMDDDARHMMERIDSNSQRLLGLINDILDLAKIEAGRLELTSQPFSPRDLAERWRSQTGILAEKKALQLKINIDPALPETLMGDAERLTQIAVNLLSNAFKFTEKGQVVLDLERHDTNWVIKVSDTGIGIPPHALNYIFDEFRQVDGTSTRAYGGSGLGLSIVRNMCRTMEGTIRVTSELGKGSVFTVTLPLNTPSEINAPVDSAAMLETA